jgi:hypothetical protein
MGAHLRYNKINLGRMQSKVIRDSYFYDPRRKKPPIMFKPSKDTKNSSLLTYIRQQKSTRKHIKVTLPKIKEP